MVWHAQEASAWPDPAYPCGRRFFRRAVARTVLAGLGLLALLAPNPCPAAEDMRPVLPGLGATDPRTSMDVNAPPWRALGRVQNNLGGHCTGTLIGERTVLTAAHCVFNERTQRFFPASSLHFLTGYARGEYAAHSTVARFVVGPGYHANRRQPEQSAGSDWAVLTLDQPLGTPDRVLSLADRPAPVGAAIALGGYSQDRAHIITADLACHVIGMTADGQGKPLIRHNCTATRGSSGAPLLVRDGAAWRVLGVAVVAVKGQQAQGLAVPAAAVRP